MRAQALRERPKWADSWCPYKLLVPESLILSPTERGGSMFAVRLAVLAAAYVAAQSGVCHAQQQAWPTKPIRMLVGFPAGGPTDIVARLVSDRVSSQINQR